MDEANSTDCDGYCNVLSFRTSYRVLPMATSLVPRVARIVIVFLTFAVLFSTRPITFF